MNPLPLSPWAVTEAPALNSTVVPGWASRGLPPQFALGLPPAARPSLPGYDSGVMSLLIVTFLIVAANFRHYTAFLRSMAQELLSGRRTRPNVFDDPTVSETRIIASLVIVLAVTQGIILSSLPGINAAGGVGGLLLWAGVALLFYIAQLLAYRCLAFAFADQTVERQWLKAYNGAESILALALIVPALVVCFNPDASAGVWAFAVVGYLTTRIMFIVKGFRLFYRNIFSIPYFILYLCALEIAPLAAIARFARA